jgi:hypothetical protein
MQDGNKTHLQQQQQNILFTVHLLDDNVSHENLSMLSMLMLE